MLAGSGFGVAAFAYRARELSFESAIGPGLIASASGGGLVSLLQGVVLFTSAGGVVTSLPEPRGYLLAGFVATALLAVVGLIGAFGVDLQRGKKRCPNLDCGELIAQIQCPKCNVKMRL